MSDFLAANNITVLPGYNNQNIVQEKPDLVVIGNALSRGNPEVEYILANGIPYTSLPELLKKHFIQIRTTSGEQVKSLVVCGTHGKTTTTSQLIILFIYTNKLKLCQIVSYKQEVFLLAMFVENVFLFHIFFS